LRKTGGELICLRIEYDRNPLFGVSQFMIIIPTEDYSTAGRAD
jgi:hypothetical protein